MEKEVGKSGGQKETEEEWRKRYRSRGSGSRGRVEEMVRNGRVEEGRRR